MKMLKLISFSLFIGIFLSSCNGPTDADQIAKLTAENDALKLSLSQCENKKTAPSLSIADAINYSSSYRNLGTNAPIRIPLSLKFNSSAILAAAGNNPYVRFYFVIDKKNSTPAEQNMTLIAVGVDNQNNDMINMASGAVTTGMYDFARPCPYCPDSATAQNHKPNEVLYPQTLINLANPNLSLKGYIFKKSGSFN